jgi:hypothetical protein
MRQVMEKKANLKYQCKCNEHLVLCFFHVCFFYFTLTLDMFTYLILPVMGNIDDPFLDTDHELITCSTSIIVDPFLSLIKSILVQLQHIFLSLEQ